MERRRFLLALAAGLAGASGLRGARDLAAGPQVAHRASAPASIATPAVAPAGVPGVVPADPPVGAVSGLPGTPRALALTVDDGTSTEVVAAFAAFAKDSGVRMTFFPNGCYRSWRENAPALRPPYGARDERIDRIAADLGHPTIAMWNGTLDDSRVLTAQELLAAARQWFTAGTIVVGHANHPTVTTVYGDLLAIIAKRGLRTVTLADVWATPAQRLRGAVATGSVTAG